MTKFITPILSYGGEVWGFYKGPDIENVHVSFCKTLLSVKKSAQNDFVLGELGRVPMIVTRQFSIIRFWLKIVMGMKSPLVNASYNQGLVTIDESLQYSWIRYVRAMLYECGFHEAWENQGVGDFQQFLTSFRERALLIAQNDWQARLRGSTRADFYRVYKPTLHVSAYLTLVKSKPNRIALTRLLTSSHRLRVETGRWETPRPPRHERLCNICRKLDDEFHFVLECKALQPLRRQLLPQNTWQRPSMAKFIALLSSTDVTTINKLAEFVRKGFRLRQFGFKYPEHLSILSFIPNPSFG